MLSFFCFSESGIGDCLTLHGLFCVGQADRADNIRERCVHVTSKGQQKLAEDANVRRSERWLG